MTNPENLYQKRPGGPWWILYYVNGRRVRRSLGTTSLREAKRLRDEILGVRAGGDRIRAKFGIAAAAMDGAPVPTFKAIADDWIKAQEADGELAARSVSKYRGIVNTWLLPAFGSQAMSEITTGEVEGFIARLRKEPGRAGGKLSRDQVANIVGRLRAIFRFARRRGLWVGADPTDLERPPQPGPGRDVILTLEEAQAFLAELQGQYLYMASVALYAGLRWGEVAGLAWEDVDLERGTLTLRRSYQADSLKSEESATTLPLHSALVSLLEDWRKRCAGEWLFPTYYKKPKAHATKKDYATLRAAAKRAGIRKHITPHVFRHSFGTLLYDTTTDPKAVQRLMRHRSWRTTQKYIHDRRELGAKVNELPTIEPRKRRHLRPV